jgi:hypothetical protein
VVGVGLGSVTGQLLGSRAEKTGFGAALKPSASASAVIEAVGIAETKAVGSNVRGASTSNPTSPVSPALWAADGFSIFWITDTQFLSEENPALFRMLTKWIVENWNQLNGKMVIHTGDIVQHGDDPVEWRNANEAMSILLENGIPYTWCAGNHDDLVDGSPDSGWSGALYAPALDPSVVSSRVNSLQYASWAGDYHSGMNTAIAFSANGLNLLVVNIEWIAEPDVLKWVEDLLDDPKYSGYQVIVAPHAYIDPVGSLNDAKWGAQMAKFLGGLTPLLDSHSSSVFLTLNGHFATDCGYNTSAPVNGRNELMFDRQDSLDTPDEPTGRGVDNANLSSLDSDFVGGATLMVLTFNTTKNQISARTYDIYSGGWREDTDEQYTVLMFSTPLPRS